MNKYPLVKQDESKDCGVSCIQMLIKYYKGYVRKNTLIEMTKTNKNGTTAYHLKEALVSLGMQAEGIKCTLNDINKNNIILPAIASVTINNSYKHFVVIYEINFKKKYLIIGDPADKIKKYNFIEFDKIFNSVLITAFPVKKIPNQKDINLNKFIIILISPHKKMIKELVILSFILTIFSCITSFYTEYMLRGISYYKKEYLIIVYLIFLSVYILKILTDYFRNNLLTYINQKLDLELTINIFKTIINLPYHFYQNKVTGDIMSRINDLENIKTSISKIILSLFIDLPLAFISLIILYIINKTLFLIGIIILAFYLIVVVLFKNPFNSYINKIQETKSESTSIMIEAISGVETLKGINIENTIFKRFERIYIKLLNYVFKYQNLYFLQNLFKEIINNIGFITITLVGSFLVIENKLSVGSLLTFTSLLIYFLEPIKNIINLDSSIKEAKNSFRRILDIITYEKKNDGIINEYTSGSIEFKNLNFTFNDREYVLKNIDLKIEKHSKVMVVGKSGSGKSTLFKLLMKYYNVSNNHVFINNIDINNYTKKIINQNILYVSQNEILFNDTLYNNLIFDNSDSSIILDISKMCCLDEIMDKNLGFNMLIEENGFNLSGGEKQRIVLARTLLRHFDILIIDEGLNQVDINLERKILKNVFKYYQDKTIIVVSHRLDNLDLFDNLVEIEDGVVKSVNGKY